ncbi:hypothetical protein BD779DRAFT_1522432 [Infundibulicybe gibba]|nr:hypothetical protein BD779DRAFT_1522432 [Infundibulicybe gibba]
MVSDAYSNASWAMRYSVDGNRHQLPPVKSWRKFTEWSKSYGPVMSFFLGSTPVIVLGAAETA